MSDKLRDLGELGVISLMAKILRRCELPAGWIGIGDDTAVTTAPLKGKILTTTDVLVEDLHFRRRTTSARDLGWKTMAVNVSDIHAMGGRPLWAVISLSAPGQLSANWVADLYEGLVDCAVEYQTPVVGGDLVGSFGAITLSVTVIGHSERPRVRGAALPGDKLVGSGPHGLARAGRWAIDHSRAKIPDPLRERAQRAHRHPLPPRPPREWAPIERLALIDDSDGLGTTCSQLAQASGVAIWLHVDNIVQDEALRTVAVAAGTDPLDWVLWGGEDYGLVAAISPDTPVPPGFAQIGEVKIGEGLWLISALGPPRRAQGEGFKHF